MAKIKDIELIKCKEKDIFVDINGKLFEVDWVSDMGKMIILSTKEKKKKQQMSKKKN